jgi:hypothetical protein
VSIEGGVFPRWSQDGPGLYYVASADPGPFVPSLPLPPRTGHTYLFSEVSTQPVFRASAPRTAFEDPETKYVVNSPLAGYDTSPDGRFLMVEVKRGPGIIPAPPTRSA